MTDCACVRLSRHGGELDGHDLLRTLVNDAVNYRNYIASVRDERMTGCTSSAVE